MIQLDYNQKKENPIDIVCFYSKRNPTEALPIKKYQVLLMEFSISTFSSGYNHTRTHARTHTHTLYINVYHFINVLYLMGWLMSHINSNKVLIADNKAIFKGLNSNHPDNRGFRKKSDTFIFFFSELMLRFT